MEPPGEAQCAGAAHDVLRLAVAQFRQSEPRRSFPLVFHVGSPGADSVAFVETSPKRLDQALRAEVVAALLSRAQSAVRCPVSWLTRPGELGIEDIDLRWYAAARAAYGEAGVRLAMLVVTRSGWLDPRTDERREWKRLRIRT